MEDITEPRPSDRPEVEQKADFLLDLVDRSIARAQWTRNQNRLFASLLRVATLVGSTLVTIFLGLTVSPSTTVDLKQSAFVIGALVTLLNALEPFFNFRSLWVEHDEALASFYQLHNDLVFFVTGAAVATISSEQLDAFRERHAEIWIRLSKKWLQFRRNAQIDDNMPRRERGQNQ